MPKPTMKRPAMNIPMFTAAPWITPPMQAMTADRAIASFLPRQSTTKPEKKDAVQPPTYEMLVLSAFVAIA